MHVTLGYTMVGLVAFRIIWGLMGTRYARFSAFLRSPASVIRYLTSLAKARPERHVGHNPAGALARFDASPFFEALGDAIITGPTGNNLRDLRVMLAY